MKPDLVDTKLFEYDIEKINLSTNSVLLNTALVIIFTLCIWTVFIIFKSPLSKHNRRQKTIEQLRDIFIESDRQLQYKNMLE